MACSLNHLVSLALVSSGFAGSHAVRIMAKSDLKADGERQLAASSIRPRIWQASRKV